MRQCTVKRVFVHSVCTVKRVFVHSCVRLSEALIVLLKVAWIREWTSFLKYCPQSCFQDIELSKNPRSDIFHLSLVSRPIGRWGEALALTFCHFSRGFGSKTKQLHRPFDIVSNPFWDHLLFLSLKSYKMLKALLGKPATVKLNLCSLCKLSNKTHLSHIWEECSGIRFNAWFKNDEVGH